MAADRAKLLAILETNVISQLEEILRSEDFDRLTDNQKSLLLTVALSAGYKTNLELFLDLKIHPEKIGLPPLPPEKIDQAQVDTRVIAANLIELADKQALEDRIRTQFRDRKKEEQDLIYRMVLLQVARMQAEAGAFQADSNTSQTLRTIYNETDPKNPFWTTVEPVVEEIIETAIPQTDLPYTEEQKTEAVQTLTLAAITGVADLGNDKSLNETIQIALSSNPDYQTPTANLYDQVKETVTYTPTPHFDAPDITTPVQVTVQVAVNLTQIQLPPTEIKPEAVINLPAPLQDKAENIQTIANNFSAKVVTNPKTDDVIANINGNITKEQGQDLLKAVFAADLVTRSAPTQKGAAAAVVVGEINPTNNMALDKKALELYAMGFALANAKKHLENNPNSAFAKVIRENPNVLKQLEIADQRLQNTPLGQEIRPSPLSGFAATYQRLTNGLAGFLPGRSGQVLNFVTHPIQSFQSYIGNFVGSRVVDRFKNVIAQKFVSKIANETLKHGAEFLLKEGLQKGVEKLGSLALQKLGGSALVTGISAALGIGTGGVSLAIQAGLMIASEGAKKIFGALNSLVTSIYGEPIEARDLLAAPFVALGAVGGIIGGLASATAVAASTATIVLISSAFVGFILYVTVIGVAPIIASIAQLESGIGVQQGILPSLRYPAYTGAILPGCPSTWPVPPGSFILQGPHGTFSHRTIEAIDVFVPVGSTITSITSGVVTKTGWGNAYGNWIWIESTTEGGKSFSVIYAHLTEIGVVVGDRVGEGSPIALSGATSSVPAYRNPHLHLEYRGIAYNSCPAGGVQIPEGCADSRPNIPGACLINKQPIYTN